MITLERFAKEHRLTIRHVRRLAAASGYRCIAQSGTEYPLVQSGYHPNGTPRYLVDMPASIKRRHLKAEQREEALTMLNGLMGRNESAAIARVAKRYGVSYWSIYRLWKTSQTERKRRRDAGTMRKIIPTDAMEMFESIYIQNAQGPNTRLAYDLMRRQFEGWDLPYRYFVRRGAEIEHLRLAHHQQAQWEQKNTARVRRDLWAEFEFMEEVSLDGWVVPDRVLTRTGLEHLTRNRWVYNGGGRPRDVSLVVIQAKDTKTGAVLASKAFERSVNQDDVLSLLLEVLVRWGRPGRWLLDNGSEFCNEAVQRFLRGLYTTEEHTTKTRIIFSEPYQPFGKGRHERHHKIYKDEFCSFSLSYSPNQQESRKPTRSLSYVQPKQTLTEWEEKFNAYLNGWYRERQRVAWLHPKAVTRPKDPINANRPRTLTEAFEMAYATYTPIRVEPMKLAFLYAKKFKATLKNGVFTPPREISGGLVIKYLPQGEALDPQRYSHTYEVVVNPMNIAQAWVCTLEGNIICEAWDLEMKNNAAGVSTRETAAAYRKVRNKAVKAAKELAAAKAQKQTISDLLRARLQQREAVMVGRHDVEGDLYASIRPAPEEKEQYAEDLFLGEVESDFLESVYTNNTTTTEGKTDEQQQRGKGIHAPDAD